MKARAWMGVEFGGRCRHRDLRFTGFRGVVAIALASVLASCGGNTEDDDSPGPDGALAISFGSLSDGMQISQNVALELTASGGQGVTELVLTEPAFLAGKDLNPDPAKLSLEWDTTLDMNGSFTLTAAAKALDGTSTTRSVTLNVANVDAAIGCNYEEGGYVRNGSPLVLTTTAAPFGASPSLAGIEVRLLEGGGLSPALPIKGVSNGAGGYTLNLGTPTSGVIRVLMNAVNSAGEYSAPLELLLEVLRSDVISTSGLADFEVSPDGKTGLLLTGTAGVSDMRLEFINLNDPASPARYDVILNLNAGVTSTGAGAIGNILLSPSGQHAYALFPTSKQVYKIDVAARSTLINTQITSPPRSETGAPLGHLNRSPYAAISGDGNYLFAWDGLQPASLILIQTSSMTQIGNTQGQVVSPYPPPVTTNISGFGLMAAHPNGRLLYAVNNWGADNSSAADLAVFDVSAKAFVDFNTITPLKDPYQLEAINSRFKTAQQPAITPDGLRLLAPVCDLSAGGTLLKVLSINGSSPSSITLQASIDLGSLSCGGIAAVSANGKYALLAGNNPNSPQGALVDLSTLNVVSVTFPNGVKDGTFSSDGNFAYAESLSYLERDMAIVNLSSGTASLSLEPVPGAVGLVPPSSAAKLRYHLLTRGANFVSQLYLAEVSDGSGGVQTQGTSLSVYSVGQSSFIFPNPL